MSRQQKQPNQRRWTTIANQSNAETDALTLCEVLWCCYPDRRCRLQ